MIPNGLIRVTYFFVALVFVSLNSFGQGGARFIYKTVAEAKFIADRMGIELSEEMTTPDGTVYMKYRTSPKPGDKGIDLDFIYTLFFYPEKEGKCLKIDAIPTRQAKWVADTIINRLIGMNFKKFDENTYFHAPSRIITSFEKQRGYVTPDRPTNLHILQFVMYSADLLEDEEK